MPAPRDRLVLTIDVECDSDGGPTWRYSSPTAFRGVSHGLGEVLAPMLEEVGGCATLLVSNVVLEDAGSVAVLRDLPHVELGSHLHGDFLPPERRYDDPSGAKTRDNQNEYTEEVERAKLEALGSLFEAGFGRRPTAFRAGRWSAGGRTARLLSELGYQVDASVTPHVHWTDGGRSVDYRNAPEQPYRPSHEDIARPGDVPIWELPVSIVAPRWLRRRALWLRPSLAPVSVMHGVMGMLRQRHPPPRTFVAMLHNNELTPGASPYSRTPEAAERMARRLRGLLRLAARQGMEFMTMTEAARHCGP